MKSCIQLSLKDHVDILDPTVTTKIKTNSQYITYTEPECAYFTKPVITTPYDWGQLFWGTPAGLTTTEPPGNSENQI